jgi:hypothetical protein
MAFLKMHSTRASQATAADATQVRINSFDVVLNSSLALDLDIRRQRNNANRYSKSRKVYMKLTNPFRNGPVHRTFSQDLTHRRVSFANQSTVPFLKNSDAASAEEVSLHSVPNCDRSLF